jgi:hypothetical protein
MLQQLQQGQGGQLPQGIMMSQGLPQNLPPGITMMPGMPGMQGGGDPMAGMTPEQKQQFMMQMQMKMGFPGMPAQQQTKKDEEKK